MGGASNRLFPPAATSFQCRRRHHDGRGGLRGDHLGEANGRGGRRDGQPVRMSKRAGTVITLDDLVDAIGVDAAALMHGAVPQQFDQGRRAKERTGKLIRMHLVTNS